MKQSILIIVSITSGIVLGMLTNYAYDLLKARGAFPEKPSLKRLMVITFAFLPFLFLVALPSLLDGGLKHSDADGLVHREGNRLYIVLFTPTPVPTPASTNTPTSMPISISTPTPATINTPTPMLIPTRTSTLAPTILLSENREGILASNRHDFSGIQGDGGWKYLFEIGRNSGIWEEMRFDGECYRTDRKDYVRICAEGEVHPGQQSRVAFQWTPDSYGDTNVSVHAHKIDTRCGDGIWVGSYLLDETQSLVSALGQFTIAGTDNRGRTANYNLTFSKGESLMVIVDIRGDASCDVSEVYIDIE